MGFLDVRDLVGMLVQMHGYHGEAVRWGLLKSAPELLQHTVVEGENSLIALKGSRCGDWFMQFSASTLSFHNVIAMSSLDIIFATSLL